MPRESVQEHVGDKAAYDAKGKLLAGLFARGFTESADRDSEKIRSSGAKDDLRSSDQPTRAPGLHAGVTSSLVQRRRGLATARPTTASQALPASHIEALNRPCPRSFALTRTSWPLASPYSSPGCSCPLAFP